MDTHYQPIYRQAAAMQHQFHDYTHAAGTAVDPNAAVLRNQIHFLTNDLAANKNPKMIEQRLYKIQTQLRRQQSYAANPMTGQNPLMSQTQTKYLHNNFTTMRNNIMKHPNFNQPMNKPR
jgi:hypothetical protein